MAAVVLTITVDRAFFAAGTQAARPELQAVLDRLVTGPSRIAPGATAYVSGPHGTWAGSAGVADVKTGEPMLPDARMRLASVSKWWAATLILQLAQEGKLELGDTVERWLPGLLPYGDRITLPELMTDTSGLIDDNDLTAAAFPRYLSRVRDAKLRAQIAAVAARARANPLTPVPALTLIRLAAWQPLLFPPGSRYHHSNIGWNILGLVAERAGGKPLAALYREHIFEPLGLRQTAFDPQGQIAGPHATGYGIAPDGTTTDLTAMSPGKFVDGGVVSNAEETATFFAALMRGKLIDREQLATMQSLGLVDGGGTQTACAGLAHIGDGASPAYKTNVLVKADGSRVAAMLLNGDTLAANSGLDADRADKASAPAALRLFCAA